MLSMSRTRYGSVGQRIRRDDRGRQDRRQPDRSSEPQQQLLQLQPGRLHERFADTPARRYVKPFGCVGSGVERLAADLAHDIEMAVAHRSVVAVADRLGNRNANGVQRFDDPELAKHVVRLG